MEKKRVNQLIRESIPFIELIAGSLFQAISYHAQTPHHFRPLWMVLGLGLWLHGGLKTRLRAVYGSRILYYIVLLIWLPGTMMRFSKTPIWGAWLALALLGLYLALYETAFIFFEKFRGNRVPFFIEIPLLVSMYWLRGHFLSGFPWGDPGPLFVFIHPFARIFSLFGNYIISALLLWTLWRLILSWKNLTQWIILSVMWGGLIVLGGFIGRLPESSKALQVGFVQPSTPLDGSVRGEWKRFMRNIELSQSILPYVDILIWSESSLPGAGFKKVYPDVQDKLSLLIGKPELVLVAGGVRVEWTSMKQRKLYNTAYVFSGRGEVLGYYDKVHLVPFGEYFPVLPYLPGIRSWIQGFLSFSSGEHIHSIKTSAGSLGISICFESIFSDISTALVQDGAEVLIVVTNDGWFGRTSGPMQHLLMTLPRAVETQRYLIFVAHNGHSALLTPEGKIELMTRLDEVGAYMVSVQFFRHKTLYMRWGKYMEGICLVVVGLGLLQEFRKRRIHTFKQMKNPETIDT